MNQKSSVAKLLGTHTDWTHYLTRPFDLFGASIWAYWYDSKIVKQILGVGMPKALFIQDQKTLARCYRSTKQLDDFYSSILQLIKKRPAQALKVVEEAERLNRQAQKLIKSKGSKFKTFGEILDFYTNMAVQATVIPYLMYFLIEENNIKNKVLREKSRRLRAVSYYPDFYKSVIVPFVTAQLPDERLLPYITLDEFNKKQFGLAHKRFFLSKSGKKYIYFYNHRKERVFWTKDASAYINELERQYLDAQTFELKGQSAFPGIVRGRAHVVLSYDKSLKFKKNEILVTLNSHPSLLPYIIKCAVIVSDEGGISSHAAVVSRELRKPCVIGTKTATRNITNGDIIEVDANKGIIRVIK